MFVILTHDINKKRVGKTMKICRKYLHHVQKSVFEGTITEAKLERLKKELSKTVKPDEDAICIYSMESTRFATKEQIGTMEYFSNII